MGFVKGEWKFYNSLDEPIPARYVQFIPDQADKSLMLNKLQISGCRLGKLANNSTTDMQIKRYLNCKICKNQHIASVGQERKLSPQRESGP